MIPAWIPKQQYILKLRGSLGCSLGRSLGSHWGLTGVSLGYHWGVTGHSRLREKAPEKNPQNDAFLHPACKAKVSSRLDGSTVFIVSPGPLLAPILASIWATFGHHLDQNVTQASHKLVRRVAHASHTRRTRLCDACVTFWPSQRPVSVHLIKHSFGPSSRGPLSQITL